LAKSTDEAEHCKDVKSIVDREFGTKNKVTWKYFQETAWPRVKGEFPKGTKAGDVWKKAVGGKGKKGTPAMFMKDAGCTATGTPLKILAKDEAQHCKDVKSIVDREFGTKTEVSWKEFKKDSWPRVKGEFPKGTKALDVWVKAVGGDKTKKATKAMFMKDAGCTATGTPLKILAKDEAQHCKDYKKDVQKTFAQGGDVNALSFATFKGKVWPMVKNDPNDTVVKGRSAEQMWAVITGTTKFDKNKKATQAQMLKMGGC